MALDLNIECLRISIDGASGHEHRIHEIASRAAVIFGERLSQLTESGGVKPAMAGSVTAQPVSMDLKTSTNEQAAGNIANAWLEALALKLKI